MGTCLRTAFPDTTAIAVVMAARSCHSSGRPEVDLSDIPELMPGAQSSANPSQRHMFQNRSVQLHQDEVEEEEAKTWDEMMCAGTAATSDELATLFPLLDAELVQAILADAPSPPAAMDTLLALSSSMGEPTVVTQRAKTPPPREIGVNDLEQFPSFTDKDGWQMVSKQLCELDQEKELGSVWCDRATKAKDIVGPKAKPSMAPLHQKRRQPKEMYEVEVSEPLTTYESRQETGKRHVRNRKLYGRRVGKAGAQSKGLQSSIDSGSEEVPDDVEAEYVEAD